ncbi:MAG: hypothetical protein LBM99_04655 [Bacillales bacterium]|jgi:shikimate dehydrogenase|nr:hypothetical protein [Bacillales bacterium]
MDECFLIGEKLSHSFSPQIHNCFGNHSYSLKEISKDNLKDFVLSKEYKGLNVTIPYKEVILDYLDVLSPLVQEIKSCNTVVNLQGKLYGYNTDYAGFAYLIKKNNFEIENSRVLILGTGGASKTVAYYLKEKGCQIFFGSRNKTENAYLYSEIYNLKVDFIINTTPIGMYPNNYQRLIDLKRFNNLKGVIDIIFNPLKTQLLVQAEELKIKHCNGFLMLVAQAEEASRLFGFKSSLNIDDVYLDLLSKMKNIVLIGMPMAGKSRVGKRLASFIKTEFVDLDDYIQMKEKMSIKEIFINRGEEYFRKVETKCLKLLANRQGLVIALGGGIVESEENYNVLKENCYIVNLLRNFEQLIYNRRRPLINNQDDYLKLWEKRQGKYEHFADVTFLNQGSITTLCQKIWGAFCENIDS